MSGGFPAGEGRWYPPIPSLAALPVDRTKTEPKPAYYKLQFGDDVTGFSYYVRTLAVVIGRNCVSWASSVVIIDGSPLIILVLGTSRSSPATSNNLPFNTTDTSARRYETIPRSYPLSANPPVYKRCRSSYDLKIFVPLTTLAF